jgi:phage tail-like protein
MALDSMNSVGLTCRFSVKVDGMELGGWASCTGLRVDFKLKEILEGGTNGHTCYVPDRISYPRVTLTRAMTADDSPKVAQWLATYVDRESGGTAEITLNDARGTRIASWTLHNVLPASWRGPDLVGQSDKVAMETLELVHEGFLPGV